MEEFNKELFLEIYILILSVFGLRKNELYLNLKVDDENII